MANIIVVVSVDWEGRSLLPENLRRMAQFRREHPDVPLQHFLNAAYYTRTGIDAPYTSELIKSVLLPGDEHGLHLHAWRSLLDAAGIECDEAPSLLQGSARVPRAPDDWGFYPPESGYDSPIEHMNVGDLTRIVATCNQILTDQNFRRPTSFRAGAWMSGIHVQTALARNGFKVDCSAVSVAPVVKRFGELPLCGWLRELWPQINSASQPYRVRTPAGELWQVPNNANLVDYVTADETVALFEAAARRWEACPGTHQFFSTGFHQETARVFLGRLEDAIVLIKKRSRQKNWPVVFTASPLDYVE